MKYKVNEIFTSVIGEGRWAGTPAAFVRFYGCNLECEYCDTPQATYFELTVDEVVKAVKRTVQHRVVLTGGEPLVHDLEPLTKALFPLLIHLETNGTRSLTGNFNWVSVSPKLTTFSCGDVIKRADEFKFTVPPWNESSIRAFLDTYNIVEKTVLLQPQADGQLIIWENVRKCYDIALRTGWTLSVQLHKLIGVR